MGERQGQGETVEPGVLVSLISCLRNEAILYIRLFWNIFLIQLSLTGILLISMGLLFRFFGYFCMSFISLVGAISTVLLYRAGMVLDRRRELINDSSGKLESELPKELKPYAVIQTVSNRVMPKWFWQRPKNLFLFSTLFLILFWVGSLIWSGHELFRNHYQSGSSKYQEVLPFPQR